MTYTNLLSTTPGVSGARFWAVDLHVHTPASGDADIADYGDPEEIVKAALAAGLDAIAITDHNTYEWCERVAESAVGTSLIVLPGVELSTSQGHLLGIWEEGTSTKVISDFLVSVGIDTLNHGDLGADTDKTFVQCCEEIARRGGISIAAHVEKEKGILKQVGVAATLRKILTCESLNAIEVVHLETISDLSRRSTSAPCAVRSSDSYSASLGRHALSAIGQRRTWIKASRPDAVGLRHALDDAELRVRLEEPPQLSYPYIESVSINGGFLGGQFFALSRDMTCLLGGTGSGKSLVIEAIRYALDQQVDIQSFTNIRGEVDDRLAEALGPAGRVVLTIKDASGQQFRIERVFSPHGTGTAVVRQYIGGEFVATEQSPKDVLAVSAFSQGEALEYSRQRVGRMSLVDHSLHLAELEAFIGRVLQRLERNSRALLEARRRLDGMLSNSSITLELLSQVERLAKFFDDSVAKSQSYWTLESVEFTKRCEDVEEYQVPTFLHSTTITGSISSNTDLVERANAALARFERSALAALEELAKAKGGALESLGGIQREWATRHQKFADELDAKLEEIEPGASMPALRQRLGVLQADLALAQATERTIATEIRPELARLLVERQGMMDELFGLRRTRRELRRGRVRELNLRMKGSVKLDVPDSGDADAYRKELSELRVGSRLRDDFFDAVARRISPGRFVRCLLDENYGELSGVDQAIDEVSMVKFHTNVTAKGWESRLLALQYLECPDVLSIQLKKPEDGRFEAIEKMSHGQRCTAILVIVLADGTSPVIVDQPEDAVHAPWIEDYLVVRLRELRGSRQYLFATRSPGLVVSGDCEQIITLRATAGQGVVEAVGSLERHDLNKLVLNHLEGGRVPFSRRTRKFRPSIGG